jgi:hypothetical protein
MQEDFPLNLCPVTLGAAGAEQPAGRADGSGTLERAARLPGRKLAEPTVLRRIEGPPMPATDSKGGRLRATAEWFASAEVPSDQAGEPGEGAELSLGLGERDRWGG